MNKTTWGERAVTAGSVGGSPPFKRVELVRGVDRPPAPLTPNFIPRWVTLFPAGVKAPRGRPVPTPASAGQRRACQGDRRSPPGRESGVGGGSVPGVPAARRRRRQAARWSVEVLRPRRAPERRAGPVCTMAKGRCGRWAASIAAVFVGVSRGSALPLDAPRKSASWWRRPGEVVRLSASDQPAGINALIGRAGSKTSGERRSNKSCARRFAPR